MDLLISRESVCRLGPALEPFRSRHRLLELDRDGKVYVAGHEFLDSLVHADMAWLSLDVLAQGKLSRFLALARRGDGVRWLHTIHAGVDLPFYAELLAAGVRLTRSPVQAPAIAEYVLAQVLAVLHELDHRRMRQRQRVWEPRDFRELRGSRWLIVGVGHVGQSIAKLAAAFGVRVHGVMRRPVAAPFLERLVDPAQMRDELPVADVVVLSCSLNDTTRGLVDRAFVDSMKEGSILVNVARGAVVDEQALLDGVVRGRPGYAVLDVTAAEPLPAASPLWSNERVVLTAHSAYRGSATVQRGDELFLENLRRLDAGEVLLHEVGRE